MTDPTQPPPPPPAPSGEYGHTTNLPAAQRQELDQRLLAEARARAGGRLASRRVLVLLATAFVLVAVGAKTAPKARY